MAGQDTPRDPRESDERWASAAAALREASRLAGLPVPGQHDGRDGSEAGSRVTQQADAVAQDASDTRGAAPPSGRAGTADDADPEFVARAIVLRQLSMAPRSRAQLERKLRQRGCADDVAHRVLDRMEQVGLVDDEAYADVLVRTRHTERGLATPALRHELLVAGIDRDVAEAALEELDSGQERDRAEALVARRLRSMSGLDAQVKARRLAGMLARKGYPGDIAWPVIRDALEREPEHQRD